MSSEDKDVVAIAMRHHEDAAWFGSGLHDPNGYIFMAHKDRGELLTKLRMLRTGEKDAKPGMSVVIPAEAYLWLMGEGPDDLGHHFGDTMVTQSKMPAYWWRSIFRRMCALNDKTKAAA